MRLVVRVAQVLHTLHALHTLRVILCRRARIRAACQRFVSTRSHAVAVREARVVEQRPLGVGGFKAAGKGVSHEYDCLPAESCLAGGLGQAPYIAAHDFLIGPACTIHKGHRGLGRQASCKQLLTGAFEQAAGEKERDGAAMGGKRAQLLAARHRRAPLHTCEHERLGHAGQGELAVQGRCRSKHT